MAIMTTQLNETLFRKPRTSGVQVLQRRGDAGARELSTHRIRVDPGKKATFALPDEEAIVVLQEGRGTFSVGTDKWPVSRKDVFNERATALYLPVGDTLEIAAETTMEAVAFSTPASKGGRAALVKPEQVVVNARGRGIYTREVHNIFVEEVYYYRVDPPQGFGQQMLYTSTGESAVHAVRDGDAVLLPYGYHPVSNPPGYRLYYLWGMAGEQRKLALFEDPDHTWIHNAAL